jgi:hypothetical protein
MPAGKTLITFAQEGQDPITFEVSAQMMDKIYSKIARINESTVLGQQVDGAADWWVRETTEKIIKPILMEFPDPEPVGIAELTVQMQTIAAKIARMKRDSFVSPISIAKEVIA